MSGVGTCYEISSLVRAGEEEIGSSSLESVVRENRQWFTETKLIIISNSQWIGDRLPCLTYGMRGMICLTVRVDGAGRDLHSGNDGGVFNEPMADLCRLLATLVDSQHNILVPGFYDDVADDLLAPTLRGFKVLRAASESMGLCLSLCDITLTALDTLTSQARSAMPATYICHVSMSHRRKRWSDWLIGCV